MVISNGILSLHVSGVPVIPRLDLVVHLHDTTNNISINYKQSQAPLSIYLCIIISMYDIIHMSYLQYL